jgi:hypothetical protein
MQLLVKTICYGSDDSIAVTHCLLALDPRSRLKMRARLTKVLQLKGLYSVTFFDASPVPVRIEEADLQGQYTLRLANRDQLVLGDWFDPESPYTAVPTELPQDPVIRIDAATVRYMPDGILWHFFERHCDVQFETETIPWSLLQATTE